MVCVDTNFIIDLLKNKKEAIVKLTEYADQGINPTTTIVTVAELYKGAYKINDTKKEISKIESVLSTLRLLEFSKDAAKMFGELHSHNSILRRFPGDLDLIIASIAITNNESVLTRNTKHFTNIPKLRVESW